MKLSKWCKQQGVCYQTGINWFHKGIIPGSRQLPTGTIIVEEPAEIKQDITRVCVYCRLSNASRKNELNYQVDRCLEFARAKGFPVHKIYKEIASGMNDKRRELWKMIDTAPTTIIVEHKDRLTRFGFEYLERLLKKQGCRILVINRDREDESDLLKDFISIITSFCCRIYGIRRGSPKAKKIKEELVDNDKITDTQD